MATQHTLNYDGKLLTVKGVNQVTEISDRQAIFKLDGNTLTVRGGGLNVIKLDKEQGIVTLEVGSLASLGYKSGALKGLFR